MPDAEWIENMKQIMRRDMENGVLCDAVQGTVAAVSPLSVQISQKLILTGPQLILAKSVTDHQQQMEIPELGMVTVTVRNQLKQGEAVLLIQKRGGQQYVIIDRA